MTSRAFPFPDFLAASRPRRASRRSAPVRDIAFRLERRLTDEFGELQLRQLRSLQRAYRRAGGPELLVIGDSDMFWTDRRDRDRRHLSDIIRDEVDPRFRLQALVGASYAPRIASAFLAALARCGGRPRFVVVPMSHVVVESTSLLHPLWGYERIAAAITAAAERGTDPAAIPKPTREEWEAHDRLPVASLCGADITAGEVRLVINNTPRTEWQRTIVERYILDFYNGEMPEPDGLGIRLITELGSKVAAMGLPTVAYIAPVNYELAEARLGPNVPDHLTKKAALMTSSFLEAAGDFGAVVDGTFLSSGSEFNDPLHLTESGRQRLGAEIGRAGRTLLARHTAD
jgi:hypothetical protein